jgi:Fur family ferric uptake transcriptional regulator
VKGLLERLRQRRWTLTPQRRVVAEVLVGDHMHLSADEIHGRAVARLPEISRATVYNTLRELVDLGEVIEVSAGGRAKLYDPNAHDRHQHLVCEGCGLVRDVHPAGEADLTLPPRQRVGFTIVAVDVVFRGRCPTCAGARPRRRRPTGSRAGRAGR